MQPLNWREYKSVGEKGIFFFQFLKCHLRSPTEPVGREQERHARSVQTRHSQWPALAAFSYFFLSPVVHWPLDLCVVGALSILQTTLKSKNHQQFREKCKFSCEWESLRSVGTHTCGSGRVNVYGVSVWKHKCMLGSWQNPMYHALPFFFFFDAVTLCVFQYFFTELFLLNTNAVLVAVLYIQSYPQKYTLV